MQYWHPSCIICSVANATHLLESQMREIPSGFVAVKHNDRILCVYCPTTFEIRYIW